MGIVGRKETERRLRIMAKSTVDMERGVYVWPDGRKPLRPDGTPIVQKAEIARSAGYHGDSNQRNMEKWFNDPYYLREVEKERARRELNMGELLEREENLPLAIAKGLFHELLTRIQHDPGSITTTQLLTFGPQLHKYGLELAAMNELVDTRKGRLDELNASVACDVIDMNPTERARLVASSEAASNERMEALRSAIAKANVIEEDAGARADGGDAVAQDSSIAS